MKCPNCDKEMDNKTYCKMEAFYHWEDEETYYHKVEHKKFVCKSCKITYLDGEWKIPEKYDPTEKQEKTILFIHTIILLHINIILVIMQWSSFSSFKILANI